MTGAHVPSDRVPSGCCKTTASEEDHAIVVGNEEHQSLYGCCDHIQDVNEIEYPNCAERRRKPDMWLRNQLHLPSRFASSPIYIWLAVTHTPARGERLGYHVATI
jgi:hypothetical protein